MVGVLVFFGGLILACSRGEASIFARGRGFGSDLPQVEFTALG